MNEPMEAKESPEVKPWARRVVEAAGVIMPANADGEKRLGWWGVEMARFFKFCKSLPEGTELRPAMEGGRRLSMILETLVLIRPEWPERHTGSESLCHAAVAQCLRPVCRPGILPAIPSRSPRVIRLIARIDTFFVLLRRRGCGLRSSIILCFKQPPTTFVPDLQHCDDALLLINDEQHTPSDAGFPRAKLHLANLQFWMPAPVLQCQTVAMRRGGELGQRSFQFVQPAIGEICAAMLLVGLIPLDLIFNGALRFIGKGEFAAHFPARRFTARA